MAVHPGQEAEYERRHRPIWPDLERTLIEHGVVTYSIYLDPETRDLFGYVEVEDEGRWAAIAQTEVCRRVVAPHARDHAGQRRRQPGGA
jgi:L-rhamnose mutarotase